MKTNMKPQAAPRTHEGGAAIPSNPTRELRRAILACLLWEDQFYESGQSIADRIASLVRLVPPEDVAALAIEARTKFHLRHAPLLLVRELARSAKGNLVGRTLSAVIQRADELAEFLAIYWREKRQPLSKQVKVGLAHAFTKFSAFQLARYKADDKAISLRDVLFLSHAKPKDEAQAAVWKQLIDGKLPVPDTWETNLSAGADKKETFERLIREGKLGYMALLRNLRKMTEVGVDDALIRGALSAGAAGSKALPFRFIAAARAAPRFEVQLDAAMSQASEGATKLPGRTTILVDVSGSMEDKLSAKSDLTRMDAACGLAILARELCEDCRVFAFSNEMAEIPPRHGMGLADAIKGSMQHGGTMLGAAVDRINHLVACDRLIVITDEQAHDTVNGPKGMTKGYMINVASAKNGVGYGQWTRLDGFSEAILTYIQELEAGDAR
jgi:60 kDa SS-A/Ro ribonucleoprotein